MGIVFRSGHRLRILKGLGLGLGFRVQGSGFRGFRVNEVLQRVRLGRISGGYQHQLQHPFARLYEV